MSTEEFFNQRFKNLINQAQRIGFYNSIGEEDDSPIFGISEEFSNESFGNPGSPITLTQIQARISDILGKAKEIGESALQVVKRHWKAGVEGAKVIADTARKIISSTERIAPTVEKFIAQQTKLAREGTKTIETGLKSIGASTEKQARATENLQLHTAAVGPAAMRAATAIGGMVKQLPKLVGVTKTQIGRVTGVINKMLAPLALLSPAVILGLLVFPAPTLKVMGGVVDKLLKDLKPVYDPKDPKLRAAWKGFYSPLWGIFKTDIIPLVNVTPDVKARPVDVAEKFFSMGMMGLVVSTISGYLAKIASWAKIGPLAAILGDLGAYRWVLGAMVGSTVYYGLRRPLEYALQGIFLPNLPYWRDITEAWSRGYLKDEDFKLYMPWHGFDKKFFAMFKWIYFRPLDPFSFAFLAQTGYFKKEEAEFLLRDMGYKPEVFDMLIKAPFMWATSPYKTAIRKATVDMFTDGFATIEEVVKTQMENLKVLEFEPLIRMEALYKKLYDTKKELRDFLLLQYNKEVITEDILRFQLNRFIVDKPEISRLIEEAKLRKIGKKEPTEGKNNRLKVKGELTKLYKAGFISVSRFFSELEEVNKITDIPSLLLYEARLSRWFEKTKEKVDLLTEKFRKELITEPVLRAELEKLGIQPDRIEEIVTKELVAKFEKLEPETGKEQRAALKSELILNYKDGFISKEIFFKELEEAVKITDPNLLMFKEAEWIKFHETKEELVKLYRESLKVGKINEEEFKKALTEEAIDPNKIERLIRAYRIELYGTERVRIGVHLRKFLEPTLRRMFEDGFLTEEVFNNLLITTDRIVDESEAMFERGRWILKYKSLKEALELTFKAFKEDQLTKDEFFEELRLLGISSIKVEQLFNSWLYEQLKKGLITKDEFKAEFEKFKTAAMAII